MTIKWFFNHLMIAGALIGWFIFASIGRLEDAWHHKGPATVISGEMEIESRLSESEYKSHEYRGAGFWLVFSLVVWGILAKSAQNVEDKAYEEWLLDYKKRNGIFPYDSRVP
mgnify:CR=1 FL=1|jgi:hypothetical protein